MKKSLLVVLVVLLPALFSLSGKARAADVQTFVLSNEAPGYLIDDLIAGGYGNSSLYETLGGLAPASGGVISDAFLETLALCPPGSEIFTQKLNDYAEFDGALAVNTDGTVHPVAIFGKDYYQKTGYQTYPNIYVAESGREIFTSAAGPETFIDAGSVPGGGRYLAFAIAWSMEYNPTTFVLSNEAPGYLIDDLIAGGYGNSSLYEALVALQPASGGVISDAFLDVLASNPLDSDIFTQKLNDYAEFDGALAVNTDGTVHPVDIFGKDYYQKTGYQTYPNIYLLGGGREVFTSAAGPETFIDAGSAPGGGRYQAFAIAWSMEHNPTTFVLSNEAPGYLIDELIDAGYGNSNLYQTVVGLAPSSHGIISDAFMDTLAMRPPGSEIFTAKLSDFAGLNNALCINADGTVRINDIFGRDYHGQTGYATYPESGGRESFTYATSPQYYIDAGFNSTPDGTTQYWAFAIAWSGDEDSASIPTLNEWGLILLSLVLAGAALVYMKRRRQDAL